MNKTSKIFLSLIALVLTFIVGYKMGDAHGYSDGYEVGYRYDCKEEIATIYSQVKAQTKAIAFTDSSMRRILHENDSLKRKEYYQKRYEDSIALVNTFMLDSVKYSKVAKKLSDSLSLAVGSYPINVIQSNGKRNYFICNFNEKFKKVAECQDGFDIRSKLDGMIKKSKKGKK